jgi:secondary thiamine-phosphate synthase enzyme
MFPSQGVTLKSLFANHDLTTTCRGQFVDVTADVVDLVSRSEIKDGVVVVYSPHTTCAIVINEQERGFIADFNDALESLAPSSGRYYRHDDLSIRTEGLEDDPHEVPNGHSHVRAALLSSASQAIPIVDSQLMLGRYQRVFFCELDSSRPRKVFMHAFGE